MTDETIDLLGRFRAGESRAADELFDRYVERLLRLAQTHLSGKLGRRVDPEDVVQSAYRSFFLRARQGEFQLAGSGHLWRLLAAITLNKVRGQVEFHTAGKRAVAAEQSGRESSSTSRPADLVRDREPTPDEAVALIEQIQDLMAGLEPTQRTMLEMRLQGYQIEEIATAVQRSERGVRRLLDKIKAKLTVVVDA